MRPYLCGATLLASHKKSGGHRPIAVGDVLCFEVPGLCILTPSQLGVGVRGGCEVIIHAIFHPLSSTNTNHQWTLLLDFSNAFHCISREFLFVELCHHISSIAAWMDSYYSCQPILLLGEDSIHSCCGVPTTSMMAPSWALLRTALQIIENVGPSLGLHLNRNKSLLYVTNAPQSPLTIQYPHHQMWLLPSWLPHQTS